MTDREAIIEIANIFHNFIGIINYSDVYDEGIDYILRMRDCNYRLIDVIDKLKSDSKSGDKE